MFRSCHLGLRMGQRAEAEAGAGESGTGIGGGYRRGGWGWRDGLPARDNAETSFAVRGVASAAGKEKWCWIGLYADKLDLSFFSAITMDSRDTQGASLCQETATRQWPSQCHCPRSVRDHKGKPKTGREEERPLHQLHILYCKVTHMARCSRNYLNPFSCIVITLFKSQTRFIPRDYCMTIVCHRIVHLNCELNQNESNFRRGQDARMSPSSGII